MTKVRELVEGNQQESSVAGGHMRGSPNNGLKPMMAPLESGGSSSSGFDKQGKIESRLLQRYLKLIQLGIQHYHTPIWMMTADVWGKHRGVDAPVLLM